MDRAMRNAPATVDGPTALVPRVLIIDADPVSSELAVALLRFEGIGAETAQTGQDGMALALTGRFPVAFVSLGLPDMDGLRVLRELKRRGYGGAIVITTESFEPASSFDAGCAGAAGYVEVPLLADELLAVVRRALERELPIIHPVRASRPETTGIVQRERDHARHVDRRVREALRLVNSDPRLGVKEIAARLNLSESRLRHLFVAATGTSLSRLAAERRLQVAARLLRESDRRVATVAALVGVKDFCRAFRARFGVSPLAYRQQRQLTAGPPLAIRGR